MRFNIYKTGMILSMLLIVFMLMVSCDAVSHEHRAVKGVLDLSGADLSGGEIVDIRGEMAFFWNEFAEENKTGRFDVGAAENFMKVPSYWSPYVRGFGVYSIRILLPEEHPSKLGQKLTNVLENYSLFADGKLIYQVGMPGTSAETSVRESSPALIDIPVKSDRVDLVFQVSVWHDIYGGLARNIYFGDLKILSSMRERGLFLDAAIIGAVLIVGLYHLMFSFMLDFERQNLSYLFLGFVFILIILFIGSKNELIFSTVLPRFSSPLRTKFIYSSLAISVPFFFCYIYFVFSDYLSRIVFRLVLAVSSVSWLVILFTGAEFFTRLLVPLEVFNLSVSVYVVVMLIYSFIREKRLIVPAYLAGYLMLVCGVVFSMLDNYMLVPSWSPAVVFLFFSVYQTVLQAYSSSTAYRRVTHLNEAYIEMEKESEKLYDLSYIDQLTSLANRRFLTEYMHKLWERNTMIGVTVGMIIVDIDFFKLYNDRYGHLAGDECLARVSSTLRDSISRKGDMIARYGGEEFVAVIPNCPEPELMRIAERMRANVEALGIEHVDSECSVNVTISAGVSSMVPERNQGWLSLFVKADEALYGAKHEGRNRVGSTLILNQ